MNSIYNVPIIPQNLRRDETIVQIGDALNYLSEVANDIFSRVNNRVETNKVQLSNLSNRVDEARLKISKLTGAKKATQVFSSSKYPAADVHRQYKSIFESDRKLPFNRSKIKFKDIQMKDEPLETLQFYHVKVRDLDEIQDVNGLGEIPRDIKSINDLLLYNTGKNPYKNYEMSDPLQASFRAKKDDTLDVSDIGAAPHSISERATLTRSATESYFYSPDLGDVPSIDVPLDLPDLPGIADDLRYVNELGPGIAPSVSTTPNVPELPVLNGLISQDINVDKKEPVVLPPPPPPPITVLATQVDVPRENINDSTAEQQISKSPSVQFESHINLKPVEEQNSHEVDKSSKPPVIVTDAHASLMEAIRKAGGSKNAKLKTTEPKTNKPAPPSGDLMADLHLKLSLRRKGISGTKAQDNQSGFDAGSAMNKVSAMIPPPPTKPEAELTNTEDEDWDE
ncbi:hypothetical protein ILUMI_22127 [Ignelater luminosus]|uniref:WASH1 WAHD domain-containing protein n=1 Tax=Ignelater luminosus TaxID=2038154 RepID=A0A8K0G323_IGNLU|nr:hypothetical protein ILUMI_22127 [Ignelater luminosus]